MLTKVIVETKKYPKIMCLISFDNICLVGNKVNMLLEEGPEITYMDVEKATSLLLLEKGILHFYMGLLEMVKNIFAKVLVLLVVNRKLDYAAKKEPRFIILSAIDTNTRRKRLGVKNIHL
uniref:CSON002904 protein n=1 Tax=Culicoides sonorensis TaxID=179676 RepID=A0A336L3Z7_CULSO